MIGKTVFLGRRDQLSYAIKEHDISEIKKLSFMQCDPNSMGNVPLHEAVIAGHLDMVKTLFHMQVVNAQNYVSDKDKLPDNTPLHLAVLHNKPDIIDFLIDKGADPTIRNNVGKTPYELLQEHGSTNTKLAEASKRIEEKKQSIQIAFQKASFSCCGEVGITLQYIGNDTFNITDKRGIFSKTIRPVGTILDSFIKDNTVSISDKGDGVWSVKFVEKSREHVVADVQENLASSGEQVVDYIRAMTKSDIESTVCELDNTDNDVGDFEYEMDDDVEFNFHKRVRHREATLMEHEKTDEGWKEKMARRCTDNDLLFQASI